MTRTVLLLVVLSLLAAGCIDYTGGARTQAAVDFQCPREQIHERALGRSAVEESGCGFQATYVCVNPEFQDIVCIREAPLTHGTARGSSAGEESRL